MSLATRLVRVGGVALGYVAAVFVAVSVAEALMLLPTALPDGGRFGSIFQSIRGLQDMFWIGLLYTFIFGFPGFLIAIVLARPLGWRRGLDFAILGAINGAFSLVLFSTYLNGALSEFFGMALYCVPGGFAGGAAYWKLVVESSGKPETV